jgi:hypothetical protein
MRYFNAPSGPSTNYAQLQTSTAPVSSQFGMSLLERYLGLNREIVEAIVGRYVRGKNKGQLRGLVSFVRCNHGGWITNKGVTAKGIVTVSLLVPNGYIRRDKLVTYSTIISWDRQ